MTSSDIHAEQIIIQSTCSTSGKSESTSTSTSTSNSTTSTSSAMSELKNNGFVSCEQSRTQLTSDINISSLSLNNNSQNINNSNQTNSACISEALNLELLNQNGNHGHYYNGTGHGNANSNTKMIISPSLQVPTISPSPTTSTSGSESSVSRTPSPPMSVPVKYKIFWDSNTNSFNVPLLVPLPSSTSSDNNNNTNADASSNNNSPFQKLNSNDSPSFDELGDVTLTDTYALRVPLSYLVNLSSQALSNAAQQEAAPWLDRSKLRSRISEGGHATGLEQSFIYQAMAAVEETATLLPEWCPPSTEAVSVEVSLSEGIVTLVASVNSIAGSSGTALANKMSPSRALDQGSVSQQQQRPQLSPMSTYNVLLETSAELLATAPSFPPPGMNRRASSSSPSTRSSTNDINNNMNSNNNGNSNSFSAFTSIGQNNISDELNMNNNMNTSMNNDNNIFNSPNMLGSSFGSWASYSGSNSNNNSSSLAKHLQQQHHPSSLPTSFQGLGNNNNNNSRNSHNSIRNSFMNMNSSLPHSNHYSDNMVIDLLRDNNTNSHNNNNHCVQNNNSGPDASIIIRPLLNMGFSIQECEAAANAIRNMSYSRHSPTNNVSMNNNNNYNNNHNNRRMNQNNNNIHQQQQYHHQQYQHQNQHQHHSLSSPNNRHSRNNNQQQQCGDVAITFNNLSIGRNSNNNYHQEPTLEDVLGNCTNSNSVWGNAGKLKTIKTPDSLDGTSETDDVTLDSDDKASLNDYMVGPSSLQALIHQQQKVVKMLDLPPELNAFVFHCNAQTRDECLEKGLFGCPSGGQYGPHSKAKKGDLLFLADFSAWTVTGIFTAKSDAQLNIDKSAWGGRFPWQIKVNTPSDLRTVHIDKINEIIGLASGSKLNMLTKEQLMQLVISKEFGPCVPDYLFKMKSI